MKVGTGAPCRADGKVGEPVHSGSQANARDLLVVCERQASAPAAGRPRAGHGYPLRDPIAPGEGNTHP